MPEAWVVLDKEGDFDAYLDLRHVAYAEAALDPVTEALSLPPFLSFVQMSREEWDEIEEHVVAAGVRDEPEPWTPDKEPWTTAQEGLRWCAAVRGYLAGDGPADLDADHRAFLVGELDQFQALLRQADGIGARWGLRLGS